MTRNLRCIATILELTAALIGLGLSIRALVETRRHALGMSEPACKETP